MRIPRTTGSPKRIDLDAKAIAGLLERSKSQLSEGDFTTLQATLETLTLVTLELSSKKTTIDRLRQILFGSKSEKSDQVLGKGQSNEKDKEPDKEPDKNGKNEKAKQPGHGRNSAGAYTGAKKEKVPHPSLNKGDGCPGCIKGRVYFLPEPSQLVRITGMAPLGACIYECDRLRCNLCGEVFTAPSPEGVGESKYDESATAMTGLLKYGTGLPFNRIEKLQAGMGIPLPAATQWDLVKEGAADLAVVHAELVRQAAQGDVLYNDDTTMKVLSLSGEQRAAAAADEETDGRTGVFTSGIVSTQDGHQVALFFTGAKHAGENLATVLAERAKELAPPTQMCDALSRNTVGTFETIVANCNAHARRKYVEVVDDFPEECRYVLEVLREVYKTDADARRQELSSLDRLRLHEKESGPRMTGLEDWMRKQMDEHLVEPNSGIGEAIRYMQKHWSKLTLFLRRPGVPLDNNICERTLKKAILHRKNALFYRTTNGAHVGDVFMSLIHSAELNKVHPFNYLVALLRNREAVEKAASEWLPWNYQSALKKLHDLNQLD